MNRLVFLVVGLLGCSDGPPPLDEEYELRAKEPLGSCVEGDCVDGFGTFETSPTGTYVGEFADGIPHGEGTYDSGVSPGLKYKGEFRRGWMYGHGEILTKTGVAYVGRFAYDFPEGFGEMTWPDGRVFRGEFIRGLPDGQGTMHFGDGRRTTGFWRQGELVREDAD
jgi:hypothetical protein